MRYVKKLPLETPVNTRGFRAMGQDKDSILSRYWWVLPAQPVKTVTHEAVSTSRVVLKLRRLQATLCMVNLGGARVSSRPAVRGKHEEGISRERALCGLCGRKKQPVKNRRAAGRTFF